MSRSRYKTAAAILLYRQLRHDADEDYAITNIVLPTIRRGKINSHYARNRKIPCRRSWAAFEDKLTDRQFRLFFRMSKGLFRLLCDEIVGLIGIGEFKSEEFLNEMMDSDDPRCRRMMVANEATTGGFICGEIKLATTIRILGGCSPMAMAIMFDFSFATAYKIFKHVISNWLSHESFCPIDGVKYCSDDNHMKSVALQFCESSLGIINGCIGALDGWIVKVQKPLKSDGVNNPQSFYSRKGYYGVNVQAICDKNKKILFRSILSRGAEHDSTAFKNSSLYKWLLQHWESMAQKGYYFIGDTAYGLRSFLLTPYDDTMHGSAEDNYNFFHSSSRISIECAFGEINLRWGIFWRALKFPLKMNCKIIDVCMRLHNFIVDHRNRNDNFSTSLDREIFDDDCRRFFAVDPFLDDIGVRGGEDDVQRYENGEVSRGGRTSRAETNSSNLGRQWRDTNRDEIARQRLVRPRSNWYRLNNRAFEQSAFEQSGSAV